MNALYWTLVVTTTQVPILLIWLPCIYYQAVAFLSSLLYSEGLHYDYIVVGSGSAGSVVAGRLAAAGRHVLLLEAGGPAPPVSHIPTMVAGLQRSALDWSYRLVLCILYVKTFLKRYVVKIRIIFCFIEFL